MNRYTIDFGGCVMCLLEIDSKGTPHVKQAMNGYGEPIKLEDIKVVLEDNEQD